MKKAGVLRKKTASRGDVPHLAVYYDSRADGVVVRLCASQLKHYDGPARGTLVLQCSNLRPEPALKYDVRISVAIEIGHCERAAVVRKIQARYPRRVRITPFAPGIKHVWLPAVPVMGSPEQLRNRIPGVFIFSSRCGC